MAGRERERDDRVGQPCALHAERLRSEHAGNSGSLRSWVHERPDSWSRFTRSREDEHRRSATGHARPDQYQRDSRAESPAAHGEHDAWYQDRAASCHHDDARDGEGHWIVRWPTGRRGARVHRPCGSRSSGERRGRWRRTSVSASDEPLRTARDSHARARGCRPRLISPTTMTCRQRRDALPQRAGVSDRHGTGRDGFWRWWLRRDRRDDRRSRARARLRRHNWLRRLSRPYARFALNTQRRRARRRHAAASRANGHLPRPAAHHAVLHALHARRARLQFATLCRCARRVARRTRTRNAATAIAAPHLIRPAAVALRLGSSCLTVPASDGGIARGLGPHGTAGRRDAASLRVAPLARLAIGSTLLRACWSTQRGEGNECQWTKRMRTRESDRHRPTVDARWRGRNAKRASRLRGNGDSGYVFSVSTA